VEDDLGNAAAAGLSSRDGDHGAHAQYVSGDGGAVDACCCGWWSGDDA